MFALLPFGVWEHKKKDFQPLLQRCCCFCCCYSFSRIFFQTKYSSKQWILIADGYLKAALDTVLLYGISLLSVSLSVSLYCKYLLFQTLNQYRLLYFGSFGFVEFNLYIRQRGLSKWCRPRLNQVRSSLVRKCIAIPSNVWYIIEWTNSKFNNI